MLWNILQWFFFFTRGTWRKGKSKVTWIHLDRQEEVLHEWNRESVDSETVLISPPLKLPLYTWKYLGFVFCLLLDHKLPEISLMQDLGQNRPSVTGCCLGLEIRWWCFFSFLWIPRWTGLISKYREALLNDDRSKCYLCQRRWLHFYGSQGSSMPSPRGKVN